MGRNQMNRKLIALIAMVALAGTGAFAQFALGVTGAVYDNANDLSVNGFSGAWQDLKHGDGYLGFFVEVGMDNLAVGASANFSTYEEDWGFGTSYDMINVDGNLYLQGHLFKYDAFLDPFLELGIGRMSKDYRNAADDPDENAPLLASYYWDIGLGLGVNLGSIGIFLKGLYNIKIGDPVTGEYWDGAAYVPYDLAAYPVSNLKFIFGAKIIF
jgi:hypothetical protein